MMHAENPAILWLLVLAPLMVIFFYIYKRSLLKTKLKLGDAKLIGQLITGSSRGIAMFKFVLLVLSFISVVIALSGPYTSIEKHKGFKLGQTDILFVTDVSNSMLAADANPSRLAVAKNFILKVVNQLHSEKVGVVVFAGTANTYLPLTTDYEFVKSSIKAVSGNMVSKQGTSLSGALKLSSLIMTSNAKDTKILCVVSDGETHENEFNNLSDSIRKSGVAIFAFGLGTNKGINLAIPDNAGKISLKKDTNGIPVISKLHEENLQRITGNKARRYYRLDDEKIAADLFLGELIKLQRNVAAEIYINKQYFQLFLLIGLFLLVVESLL